MSCQFASCSKDGTKTLLDRKFCPEHHAHELAVHRLQFSPPTAILNAKGDLVINLTTEIENDQRVVKVLKALQPERDKRAKAHKDAEEALARQAAAAKVEESTPVANTPAVAVETPKATEAPRSAASVVTTAAGATTTAVATNTQTQAVTTQTTGTAEIATGGPKMSTMTKLMLEGLGDVKDASYRVGAIQLVELVREPLVAKMVASHGALPARKRRELSNSLMLFFNSDYGKALLAGLAGIGLSTLPFDNEHIKALGKELRVNSATIGMNAIAEVFMGPVRQVLASITGGADIAAIESATGVRVIADTEVAQLTEKKQKLQEELAELEREKSANQRVHVARANG